MKKMLSLLLVLLSISTLCVASTEAGKEQITPKQVAVPDSIKLIVSEDNKVHIQNTSPGTVMDVFSCIGIKVASISIDSPDKTIYLNLPRGYYFCKIGPVVRKIVIL